MASNGRAVPDLLGQWFAAAASIIRAKNVGGALTGNNDEDTGFGVAFPETRS